VIPGLIRRFHDAKVQGLPEVSVWGTGQPRREFLHVDDLAQACLHLLAMDDPPDWVNVGCGADISIAELAELVRDTVGYTGRLTFDTSKPDGTPRKLLDVNLMSGLGWQARLPLEEGLRGAYADFLKSLAAGHARLG
jgi:GDP-L-fucose synthase